MEVDAAIIDEQNRGIRQLEQDLIELAETFKDVAKLTGEQGQELQHIQVNVQTAEAKTDKAVGELHKVFSHLPIQLMPVLTLMCRRANTLAARGKRSL